MINPKFPDEQSPELLPVILLISHMILKESGDILGIEDRARGSQEVKVKGDNDSPRVPKQGGSITVFYYRFCSEDDPEEEWSQTEG